VADLDDLLARHLSEPFPDAVEKGHDYGLVDPVMIGADIFGWASRVARGDSLSADEVGRFGDAAAALERSITEFPPEARSYYALLVRIADLALGVGLQASEDHLRTFEDALATLKAQAGGEPSRKQQLEIDAVAAKVEDLRGEVAKRSGRHSPLA
jgi:hypothetical protein